MRRQAFILLILLFTELVIAQSSKYSIDEISNFFTQTRVATESHSALWDKNIYGPILLVDPNSREAFANVQDANNELTPNSGIFIGKIPRDLPVSNTDITWNGTHWAMLSLPLPEKLYDRIDLVTHELFHCAQQALGFSPLREENNHLDLRDGRIYLRLELAALEAALKSNRLSKSEEHIRNALIFRKYRQMIYRGSQVSENSLEILEGLATYTGQVMSGRDKWEWREYLIHRINTFEETPSFVRSFAYETTPVYGFFLQQKDYFWNKKVDNETNLTDFFSEVFGMDAPIIFHTYVKQVAEDYNWRRIVDQETKRAKSNISILDEYREKFFEQPHLEIRLEDMKMSFDPKNLIPLDEDEGTVYPTIVIKDNWGILTVEEGGALLRSDWRWVIVSEPLEITSSLLTGNGWEIELNEGYQIEELPDGNYLLIKSE
ncbi:hypothetical protein ING2E5B_1320 [Fermentimonas caenicola]|jgi:hypothetical protein|uniref:Uncharacterized protein n=1 Tax=Fermentimonas caenicola TaxID=1562970 RepID=A0A098BZF4_9BACT|nr:hypothetical protein ING2E5B_1320 [Fermentimonas caenicola]